MSIHGHAHQSSTGLTCNSTLSVGEHTSVNHAWIFSALESATRGVVQLLLEDGLVDEAKEVSQNPRTNSSTSGLGLI